MHPILSNREARKGYVIGWLLLGVILTLALHVTAHLPLGEALALSVPLTVLLSVVCLTAWFVCRSAELTKTADWKVTGRLTLAAMFASALLVLVTRVIAGGIDQFDPGFSQRIQPAIPVLTLLIFVIYLLSIFIHYLAMAIEASQQAALLSREAELKALKSQVNPHFLFNSLNSISALTSIDPLRAREMCIALSDFLRNSLRLGERTSIPLGEELALTRSYLDVEKVRFGQKLRIRQEIGTECTECDLPPLLVQPLVENAIKHGIATLPEGGEIAVVGERRDGRLRVTVENPFDPDAPPAQRNGFGLASVRNRLAARYGGAGKLEIEVGQAFYRVTLSVPWNGVRGDAKPGTPAVSAQ
jgi:two-component system, LytTR family, sensor histidine kinase AlgZ